MKLTSEICKKRLTLAENMAIRSACRQLKTGCVITDANDERHASAFNRQPEGKPACNAKNCPPKDQDDYCKFVEHAESIAIDLFKSKHGRTKARFCFTDWFPCHHCFIQLYRNGVRTFVFLYDHTDCKKEKADCETTVQLHLFRKRLEYEQELSAIQCLAKEYGDVNLVHFKNEEMIFLMEGGKNVRLER
ncbi:MAG: hypothetical protein Q8Q06_00775 [bacterium]|nr:hypothetical protein [bacterium]